jgi:hypothetical protein
MKLVVKMLSELLSTYTGALLGSTMKNSRFTLQTAPSCREGWVPKIPRKDKIRENWPSPAKNVLEILVFSFQ